MKKIVLILLLITIVIICLIPYNKEAVIKINAPYFNCYQQLHIAQNWKRWQPDISKAFANDSSSCKLINVSQGFKFNIPGGSFDIKQPYSTGISVNRIFQNNVFNYSYTIIPGVSGFTTTIIVNFKSNIIKYLVPALEERDLEKTAILDFKKYMEDPKLYYGYNIRSVLLKERKVIVKRKTVLEKNIYAEIATMQNQLQNYILLKHLVQAAPLIIQYIPKAADSVQIMVGIPVDKMIIPDNGFLYMQVPLTQALIADFKGRYFDRQKIYVAIGKYVQDKYLHVKIAPFEEFVSTLPTNGNDTTGFRLTYPIF